MTIQEQTTTTTLRVDALPVAELDRIRAAGMDDFGNPVRTFVNADEGGTPLRCCLSEAAVGEKMALLAWQPAPPTSAYAEVGPVFVHADQCPGYTETGAYPEKLRHRQQLLRAYDQHGTAINNQVAEGAHVEDVLHELFTRPEVDYVHSRNPLAGCYMFQITRAAQPTTLQMPGTPAK